MLETEFGGVLRALEREGNKLSSIVGWRGIADTQDPDQDPHKASDAHVSIVGHITIDELGHLLLCKSISSMDSRTGFYGSLCGVRGLPFGGGAIGSEHGLTHWLVIDHARTVGRIGWSEDARDLWRTMYDDLAGRTTRTTGEVMSRCHPHVLRLAGIYALADGLAVIDGCHLLAARALWDASARCARYIFGDSLGDPNAEKILNALKDGLPTGLTRTEINQGFSTQSPGTKDQAGARAADRATRGPGGPGDIDRRTPRTSIFC